MRSVVFANHGLGDVLMTVPLLRALAEDPSDELLVVVKSALEAEVVTLAVPHRDVTTLSLREASGSPLARAAHLAQSLRAFAPDAVVSAVGIEAQRFAAMAFASGARIRAASRGPLGRLLTHAVDLMPGEHKVDYHVRLARALGRNAEPDVRIAATEPGLRAASELAPEDGKPLVIVAFGCGLLEAHKRPAPAKAVEIVGSLRRHHPDARIALVGGSTEADLNSLIARSVDEIDDWTGKTSFPALLALLSRASVLVTVCNGVSHVGAAAGCSIVGLYGPTDPAHTGPYSNTLTVVRRGLECSPCYRRGNITGCGNPICMDHETRSIVLAVEARLTLQKPRATS